MKTISKKCFVQDTIKIILNHMKMTDSQYEKNGGSSNGRRSTTPQECVNTLLALSQIMM